jgi:hypothetical protein
MRRKKENKEKEEVKVPTFPIKKAPPAAGPPPGRKPSAGPPPEHIEPKRMAPPEHPEPKRMGPGPMPGPGAGPALPPKRDGPAAPNRVMPPQQSNPAPVKKSGLTSLKL